MGKKIINQEDREKYLEKEENKDMPGSINEEQMGQVMETMKNLRDASDDLKVLASLPSNNGIEEVQNPGVGEEVVAQVKINPETGERAVIKTGLIEESTETDLLHTDTETPISFDVVRETLKEQEETKDIDLSDEETLQVMEVVHRMQKNEKFNVYRALPEPIQEMINQFAKENGYGNYSVEAKSGRNMAAEMIMESFISQMSIKQGILDLNKELAGIMDELNNEAIMCSIEMEGKRQEVIEKYIAEHPDDHEATTKLNLILDGMHSGYSLDILIDAARNHKIPKIKKFDLEKPQKIYRSFLAKYEKNTVYSIISIIDASHALYRHTREFLTPKDIHLFFVAFCKFCQNFTPEVPYQHAFMYYVIYNCVMLDGTRKVQKEYGDQFIENVKEVIELLKS